MTVSTPTPARRAFRPLAGLTPLLLSLAVCNAYAIDVTVVGRNGADGAQGVGGPTPNGGSGQTAPLAQYLFGSQDARNTLSLLGGNGGRGGDGAGRSTQGTRLECNQFGWCYEVPANYDGGTGGAGGNGGAAIGSVTTRSGATSGVAESRVAGGNGAGPGTNGEPWLSGNYANTGNGGDATSVANVYVTGAASAEASAYATGGNGVENYGASGSDSRGGRAIARGYGQSDTGAVTVLAVATNGVAGRFPPAAGSTELINAVSGSTSGTLTLTQRAQGAAHGYSAGDGISSLTLSDNRASRLSATVEAIGGAASGEHGVSGSGFATLSLASTRAGASVDGNVLATGADAPREPLYEDKTAGRAEARATVTGRGAVSGSATAIGGNADGGTGNAVLGGAALASLTLSGPGLVSGSATARGGIWNSYLDRVAGSGAADATLTLSGAGAQGLALATGSGSVNSTVNAYTSGALAVDVVSRAEYANAGGATGNGGEIVANLAVETNPGGGRAAVTASAIANGLPALSANARATVRVAAAGDIIATGLAQAGYDRNLYTNGSASSAVWAETSGQHAVTASATALANTSSSGGIEGGGPVAADAYGRSGSGVVNALATASGFREGRADATAVTLERGGVSNAVAVASGWKTSANATMSAIDRQGRTITFGGAVTTTLSDTASAASSNQFSLSSLALGGLAGRVQASVMAVPEHAALVAALPAAEALQNAVGAGMHAMGNDYPADPGLGEARQTTVGDFQFFADAGEHLQVFFLSGSGGFDMLDLLDLSISNNGTELFSRSFDAASAQPFFNGYLLDLGALGTGMQHLRISSSMAFFEPGSYAFNYLVGTGNGAVSAVPEASTWLMLLVGLGGMVLVARRRRV